VAGDEVLLRDGQVVALESVQLDEVEERVYNFHVEELQNYAVGGCGVLVHNTNDPPHRHVPDGFTDRVGKIAKETGRTEREIREAIHSVKRGMPSGGPVRNPNVVVNPITGEVRPMLPGGGVGDVIGNIFDYFPE
jgi:hypothetical protein